MGVEKENFESLVDVFQSSIRRNFDAYFADEDFKMERVNDRKLGEIITYNNLAMITLTGRGVNVNFKTYFEQSYCRELIKKVYKEEKYWNDSNFVEDYIKEFCNLVGGSISSLAKKEQNELGKSIPMVLTGFDEIYFPVNKILSEVVYEWEFTKDHIKFMTRMEISSLNIDEVYKLFEGAQDAEEVQDLTFL